MDSGMATGAVTRAALQEVGRTEAGMGHRADEDLAGCRGDLGMALEAEIVVTFGQQLGVDGSVDLVAGDAPFPDGFMFEDVGLGLLPVTLGALGVDPRHKHAFRLLNVRTMRVVAGSTTHAAFQHRMMKLQIELGLLVEMALETGFRFRFWINDELAATAASIHVQAAGTVTGFAAAGTGHAVAFTGEFEPGMRRELEVFDDFFVAGGALIRADKLRAGDQRGRGDDALDGRAGNRQDRRGQNANGGDCQACC